MLYDRQIREPLFDFLERTYGKIRILEEKQIGSSRADVVMIMEGAVAGIEIKSDADTYARLAGQVEDYDLYYDFNYVVVGTSHAQHIEEHVPDWWGIITVETGEGETLAEYEQYAQWDEEPVAGSFTGGLGEAAETQEMPDGVNPLDFYMLRRPKRNPRMVLQRKLSMLWRPELQHILAINELPVYKRESKRFVQEKILEKVPEEKLHFQISEELFERDYTKILDEINAFRAEIGQHPRRRKRRRRKRV